MRAIAFAQLALLLFSAGPVSAQRVDTGFLNRTITVAAHNYRYQVYVPADYPTRDTWPVILFLHGAGERGTDGLLQTTVGLGAAIRQDPKRFPAIVVFPQAPEDLQWVGTPADMALAALNQATLEFHGDPDRLYLTGISMGGHGVWYLGYRHPELFAALAPICGWVEDFPNFRGSVPVVPAESGAPLRALASRLDKTPIWILHGEMDPFVPVGRSRDPTAALQAVSGDVRYTEYLGLAHDVWDAAYASDTFVNWLFAQRRRKS